MEASRGVDRSQQEFCKYCPWVIRHLRNIRKKPRARFYKLKLHIEQLGISLFLPDGSWRVRSTDLEVCPYHPAECVQDVASPGPLTAGLQDGVGGPGTVYSGGICSLHGGVVSIEEALRSNSAPLT